MNVGLRESAYRLLDRVVLWTALRRFGLFGSIVSYQPLPWIGLGESRRARGCIRRLSVIDGFLEERSISPEVTLDVGANIGFFSLSFAERGALAYAVEGDAMNVRLAMIAAQKVNFPEGGTFVPIRMWCNESSMGRLPQCDVSLCLSIWHHWVRHEGLPSATKMLESLWVRTARVMFFDTGEGEMPASYGLPFDGSSAETWVEGYLGALPGAGRVVRLGRFEAFAPDSREGDGGVTRCLFAVERSVA
jgi:hypothetical protein